MTVYLLMLHYADGKSRIASNLYWFVADDADHAGMALFDSGAIDGYTIVATLSLEGWL